MWGRRKERAPSVAPPSPRSSTSMEALQEGEQYEAHQVLKSHQDFIRSVEALNSVCVASSSDDRMIKLWNSTNGQLIGTLEGHTTWVACVCPLLPRTDADPDDPMAVDQMLASGSFDTSIKIWNMRTGECVTTLEGHSDCARCLTVIPGQPRCIVSGGYDNAIKVWDYIDAACIQTIQGAHTREVTCLCPLPSYDNVLPARLISGSADASVKIWDVELGRCVQMLVGHKDYVRAVIALPPPQPTKWGWQEAVQGRVVSASGDHTLRVWCVKTGKSIHSLKGHAGPVQCVAALDDGARVVSGSFDTTLRIWSPQTGHTLQILTDHTHRVRSVAALPDGRFVSGADDMTVRVWRQAGLPLPVKQHKELKDRVQKKPMAVPTAARQSRTPSPNPGATMRSSGMLVNGLAMTRPGIEAQIRQLQSLLGGVGVTGGAGANAEMAATTTTTPAGAVVATMAAEPVVARKAEGASPARGAPSAGGDLAGASPDSRDGEEGEPRAHHHRRHIRDGHNHRRGSREEGAASPSPVPSQPEGSPAVSTGEASPVSSEVQSPTTDNTGSPMSGGSSGSGHREHHHRSHHHGHHHHHHRRRSHEREEAAKKTEEEEAVWRKLEDEARQKEAEVAALAELEQKAKEERRRAREARKKSQEEARLKAEEEGRALREAEERAKAKAAEAAAAAAEEAEEAKRRWKEELEARKLEKKRQQEQQEQEAAAAAAAALKAARATRRGVGGEEEEEVTGDMPVPLGAADSLEEGGAASGSRYQAMLALLFLGVVVVASAIAGAIFAATRLQPQQQQKPAAVAPISPARAPAAVAPVVETDPVRTTTTYAAVPQPELESVEAHEVAVAAEQLAGEQTALTWAEAAMAPAAIKATTHRDFTRTPLYHAGGDYYAELTEMFRGDSEAAAAAQQQQQAVEEPLTELLADQWAAWAEAGGREEWDVPRLSWALSSARVSTTKPIKPKKRRAPSVNTGALALKWAQAQQPAATTQFDPAQEATEMVLERRIARMPRRRPLAVRMVLAPFQLAIGIIKLPFQVMFGVLKVVTWPIRAVIRT